jgi:hypothetical protein
MTSQRRALSGRQAAGAGALLTVVNAPCIAVGAGMGAPVQALMMGVPARPLMPRAPAGALRPGALVRLAPGGSFICFLVGIAVVADRFRHL